MLRQVHREAPGCPERHTGAGRPRAKWNRGTLGPTDSNRRLAALTYTPLAAGAARAAGRVAPVMEWAYNVDTTGGGVGLGSQMGRQACRQRH